jgi:clan AA aspartic protease
MNKSDSNPLSTLITAGSTTAGPAQVPLFHPESQPMGTFSVSVKLTNWQNRFLPPELRGAEVTCEALVDTGAAELALPSEIIETLRLEPVDAIRVFTADGKRHEYRVFGIVEVEVQGRRCQVRAIELPQGAKPLLGAVPLEEMDWHVSPLQQKLVPSPESPDRPALPLC